MPLRYQMGFSQLPNQDRISDDIYSLVLKRKAVPSPISVSSKDKPNQESKHSSDFKAILGIRFLLIFLVRIVPTSVNWETHWAGTGNVYLGKDILFAVS